MKYIVKTDRIDIPSDGKLKTLINAFLKNFSPSLR